MLCAGTRQLYACHEEAALCSATGQFPQEGCIPDSSPLARWCCTSAPAQVWHLQTAGRAAALPTTPPQLPHLQNWNAFDCVVLVIGVVGVLLDYLITDADDRVHGLQLMRAVRAVRILRLIPRARGLRMMLQTFVW